MRRRPFLSRADRRALLLLEWVLVLVVLGFFVYSWTQEDSGKEPAGQRTERTTKQHTSKSQSKGKTYIYATEEAPVETFPFDRTPPTAHSFCAWDWLRGRCVLSITTEPSMGVITRQRISHAHLA